MRHAPCSIDGMSGKTLGEVRTHMAVFARSGERASSRRGSPWKFVLAPLVVLLMALGFAVAAEVDRAPVSGELRVTARGLEATKPALGREVDRVATVASLLSADSLGDREVRLRVRFAYPAVDASGFDDAYALASAVVTPLTVTVEDRTWNEGATGLASLLVVERVAAKGGELPAIPDRKSVVQGKR